MDHGLAPKYLIDLSTVVKNSRYNFCIHSLLVRASAEHKSTLADRAIQVADLKLCNDLPEDIGNKDSVMF